MQPKNSTTRTKRMLGFAGLYAASLGLLFLIFAVIGMQFSKEKPAASWKELGENPLFGNELLQSDSVLHAGFYHLLQLDEQLSIIRQDTSTAALQTTTANVVRDAEQSLQKAIDSLDQMSAVYAGTDKAAMFTIIIRSFRAALAVRNAARYRSPNIASLASMGANGKPADFQAGNDLLQKDNEIALLKADIRALRNAGFDGFKTAGNAEASSGEILLLKTAFSDQQKEYELLKERFNRLKTENNMLALQVTESKKNIVVPRAENPTAATDGKIAMLEEQIKALYNDLYFARIDCNLVRADAQQMISSARQRKELLSASLNMLKELSSVDNAEVQKKAKEKIARLSRIANTLHD